MAFITKANSKRIISTINLKEISNLDGEVYKKPIYFLNKNEVTYLLSMQTLLRDPEKFAIEVYKPIMNRDTLKYVYESEQPPCYHSNANCSRLTSTFRNFEIPFEIRVRVRENAILEGKNEEEILILEKQQIRIFRKWFRDNFELFQTDIKKFLKMLDIRWNIQRNINEIEMDNSGVETILNYNLGDLEKEIDKVISEAGKYFNENKDRQHIIRRFQKLTFIAYHKGKLELNDTELSDDELREFLFDYESRFKKPIKNLLIQYYRVKYNSSLSFEGSLLERLNFKACSACTHSDSI